MTWLDKQISLYTCHSDKAGQAATYRKVLFSSFATPHDAFYKMDNSERWESSRGVIDIDIILKMRKLDRESKTYSIDKVNLKKIIQGYTPAALLKSRKKNNEVVIERTGLMQLDFDYEDIRDYDIEDLKQAVFSLPFVAFCSLSCSGKGFYALALIAEPERLCEYAEHCFEVFRSKYGIKIDTSKGGNVNDLRYLSYDANMLIRKDPEILKIKYFKAPEVFKPTYSHKKAFPCKNPLINQATEALQNVQVGNRWKTVQKVAFTIGGLNDYSFLENIKQAINSNPAFTGEESKYIKCAEDCFKAGSEKPLSN